VAGDFHKNEPDKIGEHSSTADTHECRALSLLSPPDFFADAKTSSSMAIQFLYINW
jgi:hypothetical protein